MNLTIFSHHKKYGKCNGNTIVVDHWLYTCIVNILHILQKYIKKDFQW